MPICTAVQIALVDLLKSWNITCSAITSHSSGEIAAAYAVGALTKESAMHISYARGQFVMNSKGSMTAVGLGADDCSRYTSRVTQGRVVLACMNSPTSTTVSGDISGLAELESILEAEGIFSRRLRVDAAYHSFHMEPYYEPYVAWLSSNIDFKSRKHATTDSTLSKVFASPTTGGILTSCQQLCSSSHWAWSLVNPVRFTEAFNRMCLAQENVKIDFIIEIGPHGALAGPIQDLLSAPDLRDHGTQYAACLIRGKSAIETMHDMVCKLLRCGYPVDLGMVNFPTGTSGLRVVHDLPNYPWNHQVRYWSEPRHNKAWRQRSSPPSSLLGSLVPGMNEKTPVWRNIIQASDLPWVRDHMVQSKIVYPGAGLMCMAIEAALRASNHRLEKVVGFTLRDIEIRQALIIPDDTESAEAQIELRESDARELSARNWKEFRIHGVDNDNVWTEVCRGSVLVETENESISSTPRAETDYAESLDCSRYYLNIPPQRLYAAMRSSGIYHGASFQNLNLIRARRNHSLCSFEVANTAASMPLSYQDEHVIHPTTLDTVFQSVYTAMPESTISQGVPWIPVSVKSLHVAGCVSRSAGSKFQAQASIVRSSQQKTEGNAFVYDQGSNKRVITVEGLVLQSLVGATNVESQASDKYAECIDLRWAPDMTFLPPSTLQMLMNRELPEEEAIVMQDLRRASYYFLDAARTEMVGMDATCLQSHYQKYLAWAKMCCELADKNQLSSKSCEWASDDEETRTMIINRVGSASVNGEMVCRLGPHIAAILRGPKVPLEMMVQDGLLAKYYTEGLKWNRSYQQMIQLVRHFLHKHPQAAILEIGAGTGSFTRKVFKALGSELQAASYRFTDVSQGFFEGARDGLAKWEHLIRYQRLDIEQDPIAQGFEAQTYDLIIASQVLHATSSMERTMSNVHRLLRPGGKLFMIETTRDQVDVQLAFGLLPGWWLCKIPLVYFCRPRSCSMLHADAQCQSM